MAWRRSSETLCYYLELCREIGKEPQKEFSVLFNVRIQPELHREVFIYAQTEGVTLNKAAGHHTEQAGTTGCPQTLAKIGPRLLRPGALLIFTVFIKS